MTIRTQASRDTGRGAKHRRWWTIIAIVVVVLGIYAGSLAWITQQVETGVEHSIQPLPVVLRAERQAKDAE